VRVDGREEAELEKGGGCEAVCGIEGSERWKSWSEGAGRFAVWV